MASLEKIIKVTQAQYDILASGGTVGSYTGLDSNYMYLVADDTEHLPIIEWNDQLCLSDLDFPTGWGNHQTPAKPYIFKKMK